MFKKLQQKESDKIATFCRKEQLSIFDMVNYQSDFFLYFDWTRVHQNNFNP